MARLMICDVCVCNGATVKKDGIDFSGDWRIASKSIAAWRRYCSVVTLGKGIVWGKKSTVSAFIVPPVEGITH